MYITEKTNLMDGTIMMSSLHLSNMLSRISKVLAHRNNSSRVNMSLHSSTLSWFRANLSLLLLLNTQFWE